jgi:capsular exopolysaccharide synthesis family protein
MEKIKQALERARLVRTTDGNSGKSINRPHRKGIDQPQRKVVHDGLAAINYTHTKSIALEEEKLRDKRVIVGAANDSISDQYKVLRTQVIQRMKTNGWNTLAITSPTEGCGKTLTSINLSISLSRDVNHSVLLVDMDLRRPNIHSYFYSNEQPGMSDYLVEDKELEEILFNPGLDRLVVLPGNKPIANSSEMLSSPKTVRLVNELKSRYPERIVIFDMPPILSCDDVMAFSPYIDAVMLVVSEGDTQKPELSRSIELLEKTNIIGSVLNKSKSTKSGSVYY